MQVVSKVSFQDEVVRLDGKHFVDCTMLRCVLEYSGDEITLERTEFRGCRLKLNSAAGRTLNFLQCLGYMDAVEGDWLLDGTSLQSAFFLN